jgi:hypothetical protein
MRMSNFRVDADAFANCASDMTSLRGLRSKMGNSAHFVTASTQLSLRGHVAARRTRFETERSGEFYDTGMAFERI